MVEMYLDRIMDNIVSNIEKYADKAFPVEIQSIQKGQYLGFSVRNTCSEKSEYVQSNGVGLDNIHTLLRHMNGICTVECKGKLFEIILLFITEDNHEQGNKTRKQKD